MQTKVDMDWNALKTFRAIARHRTLAGAARELGVNHSTVFRRINEFEKEVGSRLFERLKEGYILTSVGEELFQRSEKIEEAFSDLDRTVMQQDYKPQGNIVLTAPDNIAYSYLPRYLASFRKLYPDVTIELLVSNESFNLSRREADIAVRAATKVPEHLVGNKLGRCCWGVYAAEKRKRTLPKELDELANYKLIGGEGQMAPLPAFRWLEKKYAGQIVMRSNNLVAMAAMAEAGLGLAILPDDQKRPGIKRLFDCPPAKHSDIWLLTHPALRHVERIRLLMKHLREAFQADARLLFVE